MNTPMIHILLFAALLAPASAAARDDSHDRDSIPTQHNEATWPNSRRRWRPADSSSEELTKEYIARIIALDQNGPG